MADMDTLMRYIRVLSDLSGQLRHASQKRVLAEIALIKLCRPSMETNLDSVLDRLRILEERAEAGTFAAGPVSQGNYATGEQNIPEPSEEVPKPVRAAPADLQRIKKEWPRIVAQTDGMFQSFLRGAVPKYDPTDAEPGLYVVFSDDMAQNYVGNEDAAKWLNDAIERQIGKRVEIQFMIARPENHGGLAGNTIDDIVVNEIMMDVEEEA